MVKNSVDMPGDDELVERLLRKDETAYRQVVSAYHGKMLKVARAIVGESIADEVVQESWLSVIKSLSRFEKRASLKTWILRIVGNCAKSRLRRESRLVSWDSEAPAVAEHRFSNNGHWSRPPHPWHSETPESILNSEQLQQRLQKAMADLPPMQQTVIILRDREGMDMSDICKILDVSESNARVLLHRARTRLWQVIDQHEDSA